MRFLFVFAAVFAVAFAQYGGPNEPDPVPTTDYPLEPDVSGDEPVKEVPVEQPVVVEPVKQIIVEEPAKVEPVEVLLPSPSSAAPVVSVVPSTTAAPVSVPVVRSVFRPTSQVFVPTLAPTQRYAFSNAAVTQVPTARLFVPSSVAPVPLAYVKSVEVSSADRSAKTTQELNEINPNGEYRHGFSSDNGIAQAAEGTLRNFEGNPPSQSLAVQGSFSWPGVDIQYVADENGYQPKGDVLPTPPPIPPQIQRALEYLARVFAERQLKK